jgi:hypothetical protein
MKKSIFINKLSRKFMEKSIFKNKLNRKYWFTLVELIIVITILTILSTIWYVYYSWCISQSRDSVRVSEVSTIKSAMEAYRMKWSIPIPNDKITVYASWEIIWYQWYAGENILNTIWYEEWWKDPLNWEYFTYFLNLKQRKIGILALLENGINETSLVDQERVPVSYWDKVWVILDKDYNPIQKNTQLLTTGLDIQTTTESYNVYFSDKQNISGTWDLLQVLYWTASTWIIWKTCDDYVEENAWYFMKPWYYLLNLSWSLEKTYCDMTYWLCSWSIPEFAVSNALIKNWWIWNYNEIGWNCTFVCTTNYTWNWSTCVANTQTYTCAAKPTTGTVRNTVSNYTQTWNGSSWLPANTTTIYNTTSSTTACNYICDTNYTWNWSTCVANTQIYTCSAKPTTLTLRNTVSSYTQTWNGTSWLPVNTTTTYNTTASTTACNYKCDIWYAWNGTSCVVATFLSNCIARGYMYYVDTDWNKLASVTKAWVASWEPWKSILDLNCTWNIIVCAWTNSWYTLQACNLWSNTVWATNVSAAYWNYYQWWNNYGSVAWWPTTTTLANVSWYNPPTYFTSTSFILSSNDWAIAQNDNLWWNTIWTSEARQWPCPINYHVPSNAEWTEIYLAWWWVSNWPNKLSDTLKLPFQGYRSGVSGDMYNLGTNGRYWSSSPNSSNGYNLNFDATSINPNNIHVRAYGNSVRCIKN